MKNIICTPFAYVEGMNSGLNISGGVDIYGLYLKNAAVALISSKCHNPDAEVMLVTNLQKEKIPEEISRMFEKFGVTTEYIPFDRYVFSGDYLWQLAFYKLCALSHLTEREFSNIVYMDTDVYVQMSFDAVFQECEKHILLYDINHGLNTKDYRIICEEFKNFTGSEDYITHYGGEFFASNRENAILFVREAEKIYNKMAQIGFVTTKGDEFIVSLAAKQIKQKIKNAGAYIYRYWTGWKFRLVSTCYQYNAVVVLHMPNEKTRGILKIYQFIKKKGRLPSDKYVWNVCNLKKRKCSTFLYSAGKHTFAGFTHK